MRSKWNTNRTFRQGEEGLSLFGKEQCIMNICLSGSDRFVGKGYTKERGKGEINMWGWPRWPKPTWSGRAVGTALRATHATDTTSHKLNIIM